MTDFNKLKETAHRVVELGDDLQPSEFMTVMTVAVGSYIAASVKPNQIDWAIATFAKQLKNICELNNLDKEKQ